MFAAVAVTAVRYEAEGFGVGELWVKDGRVVWHDLPRPDMSLRPERAPNAPQGIPEIPVVSVATKCGRVCHAGVTSPSRFDPLDDDLGQACVSA